MPQASSAAVIEGLLQHFCAAARHWQVMRAEHHRPPIGKTQPIDAQHQPPTPDPERLGEHRLRPGSRRRAGCARPVRDLPAHRSKTACAARGGNPPHPRRRRRRALFDANEAARLKVFQCTTHRMAVHAEAQGERRLSAGARRRPCCRERSPPPASRQSGATTPRSSPAPAARLSWKLQPSPIMSVGYPCGLSGG